MPFVTRRLAGPLDAAREAFPALLVTGPRQSGKTTFLRQHFGDEAQYTAAARHGQELNLAAISREAGVSQPTSRAWLGALEAGYLVTLLPPHFENLSKRVVKSPKLYFLDSALAAALTRQPSAEALVAGAMGGSLFEGFVVTEAMKVFTGLGRKSDLAFWRSHDGLEVDLLVRLGAEILPVEIKLTATPSTRHVEPLDRFRRLTPRATAGILVCRAASPTALPGGHLALPWSEFPGWLDERLSRVA